MANKRRKNGQLPGFIPRVLHGQKANVPTGPAAPMSKILDGIRQLLLNGIFPANLAGLIVEAEHVLGSLSAIEAEREAARAKAVETTPEEGEAAPAEEQTEGVDGISHNTEEVHGEETSV